MATRSAFFCALSPPVGGGAGGAGVGYKKNKARTHNSLLFIDHFSGGQRGARFNNFPVMLVGHADNINILVKFQS